MKYIVYLERVVGINYGSEGLAEPTLGKRKYNECVRRVFPAFGRVPKTALRKESVYNIALNRSRSPHSEVLKTKFVSFIGTRTVLGGGSVLTIIKKMNAAA